MTDELKVHGGLPDRTKDLIRNLDDGIYQEAERERKPVTAILEKHDPSNDVPEWLRGTDAFQRCLIGLDVRTRGNRVTGETASTLGDLYDAGGGKGAVLVPAYIERAARAASVFGTNIVKLKNPTAAYDLLMSGARFYASNQPVSDVLSPAWLDSYVHAEALQASILPLMVAVEEQAADAADYKGFFLTYTAASSRFTRVTEGAPPPVYELSGSDRTHRMHEFAFEIQVGYQTARQWKLPVFDLHLAFIIEQNNLDKEQVGYETVINGDGTAAAATNTNVSALTGGVAASVEYGNILEWLRLFEGAGNYRPTIGIATSAVCHRFDISDFGSANYPTFAALAGLLQGEGARPEARTFPPYYARSYATANKMCCWDGTKSLRMRYTAMLQETDRVISGRYDKVVGSEFTGFDILIDGGRRTLDTEN